MPTIESKLRDKVIVITGASSGLGRATALELSRRGAAVVLAARREEVLEEVASDCRALGAKALVVPTEITDETSVKNLAARALELTGRIDGWVNNAGVTLFAQLDDATFAEHRRVIETNVNGAMLGARAVLPIFKAQEAGILVNVSSVLGKVGQPFVPSYVVSKFAVRGLTETLRTSLADYPNIHACTLLPYAFNSFHFEEGANRTGLDAHAMAPEQPVEKVARALVSLFERPRRELHVPRYSALGLALHAVFPKTVERAILHIVREWHFGHTPRPDDSGNLYRPRPARGAGVVGHRPARISFPRLLAWTFAHFAKDLVTPPAKRRRNRRASLRPHAV